MSIEFYEYDGEQYELVGAIEDGQPSNEAVDWIPDFIEETDDVELSDEQGVVDRVSNEYFMGVIPGGERDMAAPSRELEDWERAYDDIFEGVVWGDDTGRELFGGLDDEQIPEFAKRHIREAILGGALFSDIESIPSGARETLRTVMLDSLEEEHGWSVDSVRSNLMDAVPELDKNEAEVIARSETASVLNTAREEGYEEQFDTEEEAFYWTGPENSRTTEACSWLKSRTNPNFGGSPVSLSELKDLIDEAPSHDADMADNLARPDNFTVHPQERHTFVRAADGV